MTERAVTSAKKSGAKAEGPTRPIQGTDSSHSLNPLYEHIIDLQTAIGNQAVQKLFKSGLIQAKLKIGEPNDSYEQEADRVAERVMSMPDTAVQMKPG